MRFFFRKKDQTRPNATERTEHTFSVKLTERDYQQLKDCDVPLKFWLPESVEKKISEMCGFVDTSASDMFRQILFIHLYGRYDLFGLIERQNHTYNLNSIPLFMRSSTGSSDSRPARPPVEKNLADVKVWVPAKMKADLVELAEQAGMKPSAYVRDVVVRHLFGHVPLSCISESAGQPEELKDDEL